MREKRWARIHLIPVLQAEEDRDQIRRNLADKAREKELLGTETRVYHSDRYVSNIRYRLFVFWVLRQFFIVDLCAQRMLSHQSTLQNDFHVISHFTAFVVWQLICEALGCHYVVLN